MLSPPVYVGGVLAFGAALYAFIKRRQDGLMLAMAAIGTVLMIAVAGMTQAGFAGNLRYIALARRARVRAGRRRVGVARAVDRGPLGRDRGHPCSRS